MQDLLADLGTFAAAAFYQWQTAAGFVTLVLWVWSQHRQDPDQGWLSPKSWRRLTFALVVWAMFAAFREEHDGREARDRTIGDRDDTIEGLNAQLTTLQGENAGLRNQPAQKELDALREKDKVQEQRLAQQEVELSVLRKRTADRVLTAEQRTALVTTLRTRPGEVYIGAALGRAEPAELATTLTDTFREAGWKARWAQMPYVQRGITFIAHPSVSPSVIQQMEFIRSAFSDAGILMNLPPFKNERLNDPFILWIGEKE